MRIFFSVGEPSGDLHGANLIRRLKSRDGSIECVGYGGPKMAAAGCQLHFELTSLAVMFLAKVFANLRLFFRLIDDANQYFSEHQVDAVVLIDYPGFNWWIARKAKRHGIPVFYYGVPQVWAWAPWRVKKIRRLVDHVLCKLPFEVDWFAKRQCQATYVGHPYFDQLVQQQYDQEFLESITAAGVPVLTLLPGSRNQEVETHLPILLEAAQRVAAQVPTIRVVVACYNQVQFAMAEKIAAEFPGQFELYCARTPELMTAATVCFACSGSVSLELLYCRKPTVIVFRVKRWAMWAQAVLLRTKYITLVNLMATPNIRKNSWKPYDPDAADAEEALMPEYLTTHNPAAAMARWAVRWLQHPALREQKVLQLDELANRYAKPGATAKAADYLLEQLQLRRSSQVPVPAGLSRRVRNTQSSRLQDSESAI